MENPTQNRIQVQSNGESSFSRYIMLYELFQSISSTLDPKETLELIIDAAMKITGADCAILSMVDWDKKVLNIRVMRGFLKKISKVKLKVGMGITGKVAETGEPLLVEDVSKDPHYIALKSGSKSELAVPLKIDDKLIGVVNVESARLNAFNEEDLELLTLLANQSAQVIKNSQIVALIDINKAIARTLSLDRILDQIVKRAAKLMDANLCVLRLTSEDQEELILKALNGVSSRSYDSSNIKVKESLTGRVVLSRAPLQILDVSKEKKYRFSKFAKKEGLKALLSVPLKTRKKIIGVITIYKNKKYRFSDEEVMLVRTFADLCAIAIENARLYEDTMALEDQTRRAERFAIVGELSVGIAHEIRNPLTVIKMIFESGDNLTGRDTEIISHEMERMNKIIAHFLDFAKPSEPVQEKCDIIQNLNNALLLVSHALEKRKIKVKTKINDNSSKIFADPTQLQQVFLNILLNSSEAMPNGGKITISTNNIDQKWVELVIKDNGPGLPRKIKENLFVPFTTTKPKGLGLGLSIVKRIIDGHNGQLKIESQKGKGTTTTIRLPLFDEDRSLQNGALE